MSDIYVFLKIEYREPRGGDSYTAIRTVQTKAWDDPDFALTPMSDAVEAARRDVLTAMASRLPDQQRHSEGRDGFTTADAIINRTS